MITNSMEQLGAGAAAGADGEPGVGRLTASPGHPEDGADIPDSIDADRAGEGIDPVRSRRWKVIGKLLAALLAVAALVACEETAPKKPTATPAAAAPVAEPEPEPAPTPSTPAAPSTPAEPTPPPAVEPTPPSTPVAPPAGNSYEYNPPAWVMGTWRGINRAAGLGLEVTRSAIRFLGPTSDYVIPASEIYRQFVHTRGFTVFKRVGAESEVIIFVEVDGLLGSCARTSVNGVYPHTSSCTTLHWQR